MVERKFNRKNERREKILRDSFFLLQMQIQIEFCWNCESGGSENLIMSIVGKVGKNKLNLGVVGKTCLDFKRGEFLKMIFHKVFLII